MRLTTQIKKLATEVLDLLSTANLGRALTGTEIRARINLRRILEIATKMDARTGKVDPSKKTRGKKK